MGAKYPPSPYGKPIDRESTRFQAFAAKRFFTPEEFACLLAGVDPTTFDGSLASDDVFSVKAGGYLRLIEEEITERKKVDDDVPF